MLVCLLCVFLITKSANLIPKKGLGMSCVHYMNISIMLCLQLDIS